MLGTKPPGRAVGPRGALRPPDDPDSGSGRLRPRLCNYFPGGLTANDPEPKQGPSQVYYYLMFIR